MSKVRLLVMVLCASLWVEGSYAQDSYVLTLEQMFALADENSKTLKAEDAAVIEAQQGVKVAKNGHLYEDELLRLSIDDSYDDDALRLDIWMQELTPVRAEILHDGMRILTLDVKDFQIL